MPDAQPEPRAGYFVSSHARPAFVTGLTPEQIDDVFDLVYENTVRWSQPSSQQNGNGHPGNHGVAEPPANSNGSTP
jgi:hypothetical protein